MATSEYEFVWPQLHVPQRSAAGIANVSRLLGTEIRKALPFTRRKAPVAT